MSKRIILFLLLIVFSTGLLIACGSKSNKDVSVNKNIASDMKQEEKGNITNNIKEINNRIIIKNAKASITVKSSEEAITYISNWVSSIGGYEFSFSTNSANNNSRINVIYKIQPDNLQSFINMLHEQGEVTSCQIKSNDITDQYYDATARLENLKKGREQFYEVLKKANTIDEILKVQEQINKISGDIESLQGKINMWDKEVAESTVELTIIEETDPIKNSNISWKATSFKDIFKIMKNGFVLTCNLTIEIISWIFIIIVSLIPLMILGIIALIIFRFIKKRKGRNK